MTEATKAVRIRVANWLLALPPDTPRRKRLQQLLPVWMAYGCEGRVPFGTAAEWSAGAGASGSSASQILSGTRALSGALLEVLEGADSARERCLVLLRGNATLTEAAKAAGITITRAARIRDRAGIESTRARRAPKE